MKLEEEDAASEVVDVDVEEAVVVTVTRLLNHIFAICNEATNISFKEQETPH